MAKCGGAANLLHVPCGTGDRVGDRIVFGNLGGERPVSRN